MKIFEEGDNIRLQLKEQIQGIMLFDFTVSKEAFNDLRDHIIEHLLAFKLTDSGEKETTIGGLGGYSGKSPMIASSKPEPKKGGSGSNIGEYYRDRDLYGGL